MQPTTIRRLELLALAVVANMTLGCALQTHQEPKILVIDSGEAYESQRSQALREYGSLDEAIDADTVRGGSDCDGPGPTINIVQPDVSKPLKPGFPIDVRWSPLAESTPILLEKVSISYKILVWTDVTKKLKEFIKTQPGAYLNQTGVKIPAATFAGSGSHKLRIEILDSAGQCAIQEMILKVT